MKFIIKRESISNSVHVDAEGKEATEGWEHSDSPRLNDDEYENWYYYAYDKRPPIQSWFGPLEYIELTRNLTDKRYRPDDPDNFIKEGFWIIDIKNFEQLQQLLMNCYGVGILITSWCQECPGYMVLTIMDSDHYD